MEVVIIGPHFNDLPIEPIVLIIDAFLIKNVRWLRYLILNHRIWSLAASRWPVIARRQLLFVSPEPMNLQQMCYMLRPTTIRPHKETFRIKCTTSDVPSRCTNKDILTINVYKERVCINALGMQVTFVKWNNIYVPIAYYLIDYASSRSYAEGMYMCDLHDISKHRLRCLIEVGWLMSLLVPELMDSFVLWLW